MSYYNINPCSRRGTIIICVFGRNVKGFQSALLQGERLQILVYSNIYVIFQSTFPKGERPPPIIVIAPQIANFNPRSRKGNDWQASLIRMISSGISIHVPARGTTAFLVQYVCWTYYFNPRSRRGNDLI